MLDIRQSNDLAIDRHSQIGANLRCRKRVRSGMVRFSQRATHAIARTILYLLLGSLPLTSSFAKSATNSASTVWSPLTDFEIRTIKKIPDAKRGEANALLRLYLLASGDHRSEFQYAKIRERLENWLAQNRAILRAETELWRRGELLHELMHDDFFLDSNSGENAGKGYDFEQSQLSELLRSKEFNCVSASLLFVVLAHKVGFSAEGVLLPSHVFVELSLNEREVVEVETTSRSGFDWIHDEDFYSQHSSDNWFIERGLEPSSFEDYQSRLIISPFELGVQNMNNQHVSTDRMDYADRMRLVELFSLLSPNDIDAHKARVGFYLREYNEIKAQKNYARLTELFSTISPFLNWLEQHPDADLEIHNSLAWLESYRALAAWHSGQEGEALATAKAGLNSLNSEIEDSDRVRNNFYFVLAKYLQRQTRLNQFTAARRIFDGIESECFQAEPCASSLRKLYSDWASSFWKKNDWPSAIERYQEYLSMEDTSEAAELFRENIQGAYLNWTLEHIKNADWPGARTVLSQCLTELSEAHKCRVRLQDIQDRRRVE